ncbi:MAG: aldehyde ferredoxin oxidoreductase C-terminal domain-containing protein [Thermoplasmata archaeon]
MENFGYHNKILRIDLTNEKIVSESIGDDILKKFVGGTGLGAKYLYEEVLPGTSWDSPENRIIIALGPLSGSIVGGTGSIAIVTKGPMTDGAVDTQANGFMGAFLKFAGYDGMIIMGRAEKWKYLFVSQDYVDIKNAEHLLSMDTYQTEDAIKIEIGGKKELLSVFSIGPAGERLVKFSALIGDRGHVASKGGVGAVFGSKKLKAIVVKRGEKLVNYKDPERLKSASLNLYNQVMKTVSADFSKWGTQSGFVNYAKIGWLPVKNYNNVDAFPLNMAEKLSGQYTRTHFEHKIKTCWGCRIAHNRYVKLSDGDYKNEWIEEPEYEAVAAFGPQILVDDPKSVFEIATLVDKLGLDANESGWMLGFIMECYEKGILKIQDLGGINAEWSNAESAKKLLIKIVNREGMGNLFAEGVKAASMALGTEAKNIGIYTLKGVVPRGHDHRNRWYELFDNCMTNTSTLESQGGSLAGELMGFEKIENKLSVDIARMNARYNGWHIFENSLVICRFNTMGLYNPLLEAVNATTGWDLKPEDIFTIGKRTINLLRVFNFKHGYDPNLEKPSPRYGSIPKFGIGKDLSFMDNLDKMTRIYRQEMGWDIETGKPLPQTLKDLGLDFIKL